MVEGMKKMQNYLLKRNSEKLGNMVKSLLLEIPIIQMHIFHIGKNKIKFNFV